MIIFASSFPVFPCYFCIEPSAQFQSLCKFLVWPKLEDTLYFTINGTRMHLNAQGLEDGDKKPFYLSDTLICRSHCCFAIALVEAACCSYQDFDHYTILQS